MLPTAGFEPGEVPPARMLGSDGIDGSEPPVDEPGVPVRPGREPVPPGLVPVLRERILRSPSVGVNSLMTLSTRESVTIFFAFDKNAQYDSSMSSKSIGPSHSSQRHDGALNGVTCARSRVSTSSTFSRSQLGQKYGA